MIYKKLLIKKIVILSLLVTIAFIFSYLEGFFFPKITAYGTLELHFFPIFLGNYLFSEYYGIFLATIFVIFNFLFVPSNFIVSFWSFLLDYVTPTYLFVVFFCIFNVFFQKNKLQVKSLTKFQTYFWLIFLIFLGKIFANTLSGALFFHVVFWKSLILNLPYNLLTFGCFLLIYPKLATIVRNFQEKYTS